MFCIEEKGHFCSRAQHLNYAEGKHSIFGILKCSIDKKKNNDFVEFKDLLNHRKQVPLLHNTVLILCYEEDGSVDVI